MTTTRTTTLNVRNFAQKVLFDTELSGQISDGMWENTRPHDHWMPWCSCEVVVNPADLGRDFSAIKDNYNFCNGELLDIVGERMVLAVNIALEIGADAFAQLTRKTSLPDCPPDFVDRGRKFQSDYFTKRFDTWEKYGLTEEVFARIAAKPQYTRDDMMRDLRDLKQIIRQRRFN